MLHIIIVIIIRANPKCVCVCESVNAKDIKYTAISNKQLAFCALLNCDAAIHMQRLNIKAVVFFFRTKPKKNTVTNVIPAL